MICSHDSDKEIFDKKLIDVNNIKTFPNLKNKDWLSSEKIIIKCGKCFAISFRLM